MGSPVHGQAAGKLMTCDEIGVPADEEGDRTRDVHGLDQALQGDGAFEAAVDLLAVLAFAREGAQQARC